jgi:hypothetical protein
VNPVFESGIVMVAIGVLGELVLGRFHGFFDMGYIQEANDPFKLLMVRAMLVLGVALIIGGGLIELL